MLPFNLEQYTSSIAEVQQQSKKLQDRINNENTMKKSPSVESIENLTRNTSNPDMTFATNFNLSYL